MLEVIEASDNNVLVSADYIDLNFKGTINAYDGEYVQIKMDRFTYQWVPMHLVVLV